MSGVLTLAQAETLLDLLADSGLRPVMGGWLQERARLIERGPFGASYVTAYGGCVRLERDGSLRVFGEDAREQAEPFAPAYQALLREWRLTLTDADLAFAQPGARGRLSPLAEHAASPLAELGNGQAGA